MKNIQNRATIAADPLFLWQEQHLVELAQAMARGDELETERLLKAIDATIEDLSGEQILILSGMSADLYMIENGEMVPPYPGKLQTLQELLHRAYISGEYWEVLRLLRFQQTFLAPDKVAHMRGTAYGALGMQWAALAFLQNALERDPSNINYQSIVAVKYMELGLMDEARKLARDIVTNESSSPSDMLLAATILFKVTLNIDKTLFDPLFMEFLELLGHPENQIQMNGNDLAHFHILQGSVYESQGNDDMASIEFDAAIAAQPSNATAHVLRGKIRLGIDHSAAIEDFIRSIELGTNVPLPFLVVAREHLLRNEFGECIKNCSRLLDDPVIAVRVAALQFTAIAMANLGSPEYAIEKLFQAAMQLDPLDSKVRHNYEVFRSSLVASRPDLSAFDFQPQDDVASWQSWRTEMNTSMTSMAFA